MKQKGTYVAYDAEGVYDHELSNLHTFVQLQRWQNENPSAFNFLNMQEIMFSSMHDDLVDSTLKVALLRKMECADNLLVLASDVMNVKSPILNWQISRAVNRFHLPVVVAYVNKDRVTQEIIDNYRLHIPAKICKYMDRDSARMAHVPLSRDKLARALAAYSLSANEYPWDSTTIY